MNEGNKVDARAPALPHERPGSGSAPEYRRPWPATWWLRRRTYFLFMLRELTSLFVGGYAVFLLVLVSLGPETVAAVLESPLSVVLHLVALLMVGYHSVTWFLLAPKVLVVWRGEERIDPGVIAGAHFIAWAAATVLVVGLAVFFSR